MIHKCCENISPLAAEVRQDQTECIWGDGFIRILVFELFV